jgi:hypothetical protein
VGDSAEFELKQHKIGLNSTQMNSRYFKSNCYPNILTGGFSFRSIANQPKPKNNKKRKSRKSHKKSQKESILLHSKKKT